MSKKTANDLMAEEIYNLVECYGCDGCPVFRDDENACEHLLNADEISVKETDCIERLKQHFQQQADIPDGWDVVRELLKIIRTTNKFELESYLENVICTRLRQAGLEVEDE